MCRRVAISVESKEGFESSVDPRFGRANAFVIFDSDTGEFIDEFDNEYADTVHGAGTATALAMSNNIIDAVISGGFGQKAYQMLSELGIEMWIAPDITVEEAMGWFDSGILEPVTMVA